MPSASDTKRAALALAAERLEFLHIVVLDYDVHGSQLLRRTLSSCGVTQTYLFRDSVEALDLITKRPLDIVMVAHDAKPANGLEFTHILRAPDSPNRLQPIIFITPINDQERLRQAYDAGVNEIILEPFNTRSVLERITNIIDFPRDFILSHHYNGPDRRRRDESPPNGLERRSHSPEAEPLAIDKEQVKDVFIDKRPRVIHPDFALKFRIEAAAMRGTGNEGAGGTSDSGRMEQEFVQWMIMDVDLLRQAQRELMQQPKDPALVKDTICTVTRNIRARALTSGYSLAAVVATALHDFCKKRLQLQHPQHLTIISKHIDTLQAIFAGRMIGKDHPLVRQLIDELAALVKKYT